MNCLEFRRASLADPGCPGDEATGHCAACPGCAEFLARARALDAEIGRHLAVPAPDGLEERILERTLADVRLPRRRFLAAAASVAGLAVAGAAGYMTLRDDPDALAGITFVVEEEANAILTAKPADVAQLRQVASSMDIGLPAQLGEIRYIGTCPYRGTIAHHVIVTTPQGKATLLLLPEKPATQRGTAWARGLRSIVMPAGRGSATVVAETVRGVERIERMLRSA